MSSTFSLSELDRLISAQQNLRQKFAKRLVSCRELQDVVNRCWSTVCDSRKTETETETRSLASEFLLHNQKRCHVTRDREENFWDLTFVTVKQMIDWSQQKVKEAYLLKAREIPCNHGNGPGTSIQDLNDRLFCTVSVKSNLDEVCKDWLLCGFLTTDKVTGHMILSDQSGSIPCVITRVESANRAQPNVLLSPSHKLYSPAHEYACTDLLDKFVYVTRYNVVSEHFVVSRYPSTQSIGDDQYIDKTHHKTYLTFSMKDVHISNRHKVSNIASFPQKATETSNENKESLLKLVVSQRFLVLYKGSLHIQKRLQTGCGLIFYATVRYLEDAKCTDSTEFTVRRPCAHTTEEREANDSPDHRPLYVLYFGGQNVKWYHMLHAGSTYIVCRPKPPEADWRTMFTRGSLPQVLQNAVGKTLATVCVRLLDGDIQIITDKLTVFPLHASSSEDPQTQPSESTEYGSAAVTPESGQRSGFNQVHSVCAVLKKRDASQNLSLVGKIVCRRFESVKRKYPEELQSNLERENGNFGVSTLGGPTLVLTLCALSVVDATVTLYWRCDSLSYPLGLLIGATVLFSGLELRMSKVGRHYLSYGVNSSHWVLSVMHGEPPAFHLPRPFPVGLAPITTLSHLWTVDQSPGLVTIVTHVQQVLRVNVSATCGACGAAWCVGEMKCERCHGDESVIKAKASCIVDDGTGTAMAFCNTIDTVAKLLQLSEAEWQAVQYDVMATGAVSIQPRAPHPSPSPLSAFLSSLLTSAYVRRSITLTARRFRSFLTPGGDKHPSLAKFEAHDFPLQPIDLGPSYAEIHTRSLPWLQVECVDIKETQHMDVTQAMLDQSGATDRKSSYN